MEAGAQLAMWEPGAESPIPATDEVKDCSLWRHSLNWVWGLGDSTNCLLPQPPGLLLPGQGGGCPLCLALRRIRLFRMCVATRLHGIKMAPGLHHSSLQHCSFGIRGMSSLAWPISDFKGS